MELSEPLKTLFIKTTEELKSCARRRFMARAVKVLGRGGRRRAEREFGWNGVTIRKELHELDSGLVCIDAYSARGRKRAEEHLPNLLEDNRELVDAQSQADPKFKTTRLYTRLTAAEVRRRLMKYPRYTDEALPTAQTIIPPPALQPGFGQVPG
jgi:hypothetical protein